MNVRRRVIRGSAARPATEPGLEDSSATECGLREAVGEGAAELLCRLGPSRLDFVLDVIQAGRDGGRALVEADGREPRTCVLRLMTVEAEERLGLRLIGPIADAEGGSRLSVMFWATHGALSPRWAHVLLLQLLCAATVEEVAALLRVRPADIQRRAARAERRVRAFRLEPHLPSGGPELTASILVAARRLHDLAGFVPPVDGPGLSGRMFRELVRRWQQFLLFHPLVARTGAGRQARFKYFRQLEN